MHLVGAFVEVCMEVSRCANVDRVLKEEGCQTFFASPSFLDVLIGLEKKAFLRHWVTFGDGERHVKESLLVGVLVVFLFEDALVVKSLGLLGREFTSLLQGLLELFKGCFATSECLACLSLIHFLGKCHR